MPDFFLTVMGRKFYEADVPRIAKALERIAGALEKHGACEHDATGSMGLCVGTGTRQVDPKRQMLPLNDGYGECGICGRAAKFDDRGNLAAHEARLKTYSVPMGEGDK